MPPTRRRRIVRRAVMALAVVVLLPVWYVAAWLAVSRAAHDGVISFGVAAKTRPVFQPLLDYCNADLPGSAVVSGLWYTAVPTEVFVFGGEQLWSVNANPLMPRYHVRSATRVPNPARRFSNDPTTRFG